MKRNIFILALLAVLSFNTSFASGSLTAYLTCSTFNNSTGHSYIESYLTVIGNTAIFLKDSNNKFQAKVSVYVTFLKGDSIVMEDNYYLHSQEITDTLKKPDFIDVQRYWLKQGVYTMRLAFKDENNPKGKPVSVKQKVNIGFSTDSLKISDAEFLQSYAASDKPGILHKNGFDLTPYVYSYYPEEVAELKFYAEVYNAYKLSGIHEKFIVKYYIESNEDKKKLDQFSSISVQESDTLNPVLGGFNIKDLPSGSYCLRLQVIDKSNTVKASRCFNFIRHNVHAEASLKSLASIDISNTFVSAMNNKDTLMDYIQCLGPISNLSEKDFADIGNLRKTNITLLKQFFYNFWQSRSPANPESEWKRYHTAVKAVNKEFGTYSFKGYQTDRGRVYLQYGAPNQRVRSDMNPSSYPYEIWEYYKLNDGEVDKKFVFYSTDIVTNNYTLLHSDAKGEIQNRQWQVILNSRNGQPNNVDQNSVTDPFGENALDDFSNPR
jgi:GWxTD domain-containing protein